MEPDGTAAPPQEEMSAALEEMSLYNRELKVALEESNARVVAVEMELEALRGQWDDARKSLEVSAARENEMQGHVAELEAKLAQSSVELENERKLWMERYEVEKETSEQLRRSLDAARHELEAGTPRSPLEVHGLQGKAAHQESEQDAVVGTAHDDWKDPAAAVSPAATVVEASDTNKAEGRVTSSPENSSSPEAGQGPVKNEGEDGEQRPGDPGREASAGSPPGPLLPPLLLNIEDWVHAATRGDGTSTPLAVNEEALRRNLQTAMARLEGMQDIQEKWRKQVERMDEVEAEWKGRLDALEQERDELVREVEFLQEDLRREQDLSMEGGLVAEEEWRKRQEAEREVAELKRELAKQKKVAREALMCIPRSSLGASLSDELGSAAQADTTQLDGLLSPSNSPGDLLLSPQSSHEPAVLSLSEPDKQILDLGDISKHAVAASGEARSLAKGLHPAPESALEFEELLQKASSGGSSASIEKDKLVHDASEKVEGVSGGSVPQTLEGEGPLEGTGGGPKGAGEEILQQAEKSAESLMRLSQEVSALRKEVLDLRVKLAGLREQAGALEADKKDLEHNRAFGKVCLQLVTNARDKYEEQIAMATRHAMEASSKARETEKQLFALLADIASLLKEHEVQAKNNGSTYLKYKIGRKEIEIVKEDLRQLVKFVQMRATLAEKGRQKNKTKAAADAARPRLAELRDGAIQEEEVLAELERELEEARKRAEEYEKMQSMAAAMREKERLVREHVEKEVRAVQAKMQEAEIMKQQVEALKQTEQVLAKELADEVNKLKVKSLNAEEVEGRISALEATEDVIRQEVEAKTARLRELDKQYPRLMGLTLGMELPPPGLLGRKPQEELAWKEKRKVMEDLKVMREQYRWTQQSLLKSRQRLPELVQEVKECKGRVEEKEREIRRVQQWLKDHDSHFAAARGGNPGDAEVRKSSTWGSWWKKKDDNDGTPRLGPMALPRVHPMSTLLGGHSSDEGSNVGDAHARSPVHLPAVASSPMPGAVPLDGQGMVMGTARSAGSVEAQKLDLQQKYHQQLMQQQQRRQQQQQLQQPLQQQQQLQQPLQHQQQPVQQEQQPQPVQPQHGSVDHATEHHQISTVHMAEKGQPMLLEEASTKSSGEEQSGDTLDAGNMELDIAQSHEASAAQGSEETVVDPISEQPASADH